MFPVCVSQQTFKVVVHDIFDILLAQFFQAFHLSNINIENSYEFGHCDNEVSLCLSIYGYFLGAFEQISNGYLFLTFLVGFLIKYLLKKYFEICLFVFLRLVRLYLNIFLTLFIHALLPIIYDYRNIIELANLNLFFEEIIEISHFGGPQS